MSNRNLHSVAALFRTPDELLSAVKKVYAAGYRQFDVHTPYPLHGLDEAMHLKPTMLPWFTLVFALGAVAVGFTMAFWTSGDPLTGLGRELFSLPYWLERYPLMIGGKPLFSLPSWMPVIFETMMILTVVLTFFATVGYFCGLPNNGHALHDTRYMQMVSSDHFGITIESSDPLFEAGKVRDFLLKSGAISTEEIQAAEPYRARFWHTLIFVFVIVNVIGAVALKVFVVFNIVLYIPPFTWMAVPCRCLLWVLLPVDICHIP